MITQASRLPPIPAVGRQESFYAKLAHDAQIVGNPHAHEAAKVVQYITLAMDPALHWDEKLKYFKHALRRHCQPPPLPDDEVWAFYRQLAQLVRQHAGAEALRIASAEDDMYAARLSLGQARPDIENEAEQLFAHLMGMEDECPDWCPEEDWHQLRMIRDQWI
jgi:hypothetical protein